MRRRLLDSLVTTAIYAGTLAFGALIVWLDGSRKRGWPGEMCERCGRRSCVGFLVADGAWEGVVRSRWKNTLCAACFDELAEEQGVPYRFLATYPVSWSDWLEPGPFAPL